MAEERKAFRGRFLRQRLCDSSTVAALVKEQGPWAGLFFDRLILHSDDDGRFLAEPGVAGAKCFPHHRRPIAEIRRFLAAMDALGFIVLYSDDIGTRYGAWRKWRKHQPKPRSDRYIPSELPPPPDGTTDGRSARQTARQTARQSGATEEEEEIEIEEEIEEEGAGAPPRPTWPAESAALKSIPGYPFDAAKDRALMDSLAETYGQLDLAKELRKLKVWAQAKGILPLKGQVGPRQRVRRWMQNADRYSAEDRSLATGGRVKRHAPATADQFTQTGEVKL